MAAVEVMYFFEKHFVLVLKGEVDCLGVSFGLVEGDIFDLDQTFVVLVEIKVDDLELEEGVVVRLVWGCMNGRLCFLWCLSWMSLAEKISSIGGRFFGIVIREDLFMELFLLDGTSLGKVTGSKKEEKFLMLLVWGKRLVKKEG